MESQIITSIFNLIAASLGCATAILLILKPILHKERTKEEKKEIFTISILLTSFLLLVASAIYSFLGLWLMAVVTINLHLFISVFTFWTSKEVITRNSIVGDIVIPLYLSIAVGAMTFLSIQSDIISILERA